MTISLFIENGRQVVRNEIDKLPNRSALISKAGERLRLRRLPGHFDHKEGWDLFHLEVEPDGGGDTEYVWFAVCSFDQPEQKIVFLLADSGDPFTPMAEVERRWEIVRNP